MPVEEAANQLIRLYGECRQSLYYTDAGTSDLDCSCRMNPPSHWEVLSEIVPGQITRDWQRVCVDWQDYFDVKKSKKKKQ